MILEPSRLAHRAICPHGRYTRLTNLPTRNISGKAPEAAPTQQLGAHGALPTQQLDDARTHDEAANIQPPANPTQRITDPSVQQRIRRDSRPDAGGTQVFKKR